MVEDKDKNLKILYVITGLELGGAERVLIQLAEKMNNLNHSVKIIYLTGNVKVQPNNKDIEIIGLNLNSSIDFVRASNKYRQIIHNFRPNVIHAHMFHANIFIRLNSIFLSHNIKLICSAHSSNEGGMLRMFAYRLTNRLSDLLTNVSDEATQNFIKKKAARSNDIITMYNGIDLSKFRYRESTTNSLKFDLGLNKYDKIILAVGRIEEPKDYPTLINAIRILSLENINFKLLIAGEGSRKKEIENLIDKMELSEYVSLLGNRNDIPELMSLSDVYVLSSKFEGLPTVLIEAMACGKFIVSTECSGAREIVGNTGLLVPVQDPIALASALRKALNLNNNLISENAVKARLRAKKLFSIDTSVTKWLKIYKGDQIV